MIPVRVGGEAGPRPQPRGGEIGGQRGKVGDRYRRVDDQAPAVAGGHHRAGGDAYSAVADQDARRISRRRCIGPFYRLAAGPANRFRRADLMDCFITPVGL